MAHRRSYEDELENLFPNQKDRETAREAALERAHDIRKFEIGLYWRRTAYFWTLLAAVFAAFFLIQDAEKIGEEQKKILSSLMASIGVVLSFGWFLANKGSKFWQENWESVVEQIEDKVTGPLYKTEVSRCQSGKKLRDCVTGPGRFSVSRINQLAVGYVMLIWGFLFVYSLFPMCFRCPIDVILWVIAASTLVMIVAIFGWGKSSEWKSVSRFTNRTRELSPCRGQYSRRKEGDPK